MPHNTRPMDNWFIGRNNGCSGKKANFFEKKSEHWLIPLTSLGENTLGEVI
jgi:hypothetical protein